MVDNGDKGAEHLENMACQEPNSGRGSRGHNRSKHVFPSPSRVAPLKHDFGALAIDRTTGLGSLCRVFTAPTDVERTR